MENEEYIVIGEKAIIDTENGGKRILPNYKGLEKKLKKMNILYFIQNQKKKYNSKFFSLSENRNKYNEWFKKEVLLILATGLLLLGASILFSLEEVAFFCLMGVVFGIESNIFKRIEHKVENKEKNGHEMAQFYLNEKELEIKEEIKEIEKIETETIIQNSKEEFQTKECSTSRNQDIEICEIPWSMREENKIENNARFYYDYAYNKKKYMLYYKLGILRKKLEKKYFPEEVMKMEECIRYDVFKEEDDQLTRERKNKKRRGDL